MTDSKPTAPPAGETDAKAPLLSKLQWLMCAGGLLALIAVSIAVTLLLFPSADKPEPAVAQETREGQSTAALEARLRETQQQQAQLQERLARLEATPPPAAIPPALLARLNDQEVSLQHFLTTLQQGMGDLSRMVQGSRDWLELYSEELEALKSQSRQRQEELKALGHGDGQ